MKKGLSIKTKVAISAIVFMGILTLAIATVGYKLYRDSVMESYVSYSDTVLEYAYRAAEEHSFGDMIAARQMPEDYEAFRLDLNRIKDSSKIEYLYAIYFADVDDLHSLHYAINAKSQAELEAGATLTMMGKPCEEGAFPEDTLITLQQAVKSGKRDSGTMEAYSEGYGHMLNGYRVVFDSSSKAVGLLCVEININRINDGLHRYVRTVVLIAAVFTALVVLAYLFNTKRYLIGPVEQIAKRSDAFVQKMQSNAPPEELVFEDVTVKSGGELALMADNVKSLADGVATYMTNLQAVTAEKERIGAELSLATRIQAAMLPHIFPAFPDRAEFDIYASMDPAKEVGGDFYDFFLIDDDHLCIVMADVSGKGVPAALFMMASKIILQSCAMLGKSPAEILTMTNQAICSNNQEEMFVTVWVGILELSTGKLTAANAGHEYPVLKQPDGSFALYRDKHGFVIGGMEGVKYKEYEIKLEPGAKLFLYTDGVPEATNADTVLFGTDRMLEALNTAQDRPPEEVLKTVRRAVDNFVQDAEQFDDLTMLCLHYLGQAKSAKELTVEATVENIEPVTDFVNAELEALGCPVKTQMQIDVAIDELMSNIAKYAYNPETGPATVRVEVEQEPLAVAISFIDHGVPYDPLAKADPNIAASAEDRPIGGLGIFITKKLMDVVAYEYKDGRNILTLKKNL